MYCASRLHHLCLLPLFPPSDEEENDIAIYQNKKFGGKDSWKDEQISFKIHHIYRLKKIRSCLIQILYYLKSRFISWILWHVKSAKYDPPLPHDLIHYDSTISIMNLPTVLTHFNFQKSSRYENASQPLSFKVQRTTRLLKLEERSMLFPPSISETQRRKIRRHL